MIYTDVQLKEKIIWLINEFESEVVEFKEAKTNYSFNEIGKYFSALSNEANIRGFQEAWLVFGIQCHLVSNKDICCFFSKKH